MTIIEKETNLRQSRVLQSIRIPDANAEEDLHVLYQIFDPREEACERCKYPVFVAVDIGIFGGVRMDGLAILDTAKLGSASKDGLISTYNLVSDSSAWGYYLAARFFRFWNPTKTRDPASHMKKLLTRQIFGSLGSLSELRPQLPTTIGNAGNNANVTLRHLLHLGMEITQNNTQTKRMEMLDQAALFPGYTPEKSPAEAAMLKKELDQGLLAEERERKIKKTAERSKSSQKIFGEMRRELVTLRSGVDQVGTDLALLLEQQNVGPEPHDLMCK